MSKTIERCIYYTWARHQRETELQRGQGLEGTKNYENVGCYKCEGYNIACKYYEKILKKKAKLL